MITRTATARYEGMGKTGKGWMSTGSGALSEQRYGFGMRFEDEPGTNPEELIAAAHAGCFTMALAIAVGKQGVNEGRLETTARVTLERDGGGFRVSRSDLQLTASVPEMDEQKLRELAEEAKSNCPISKLLDAEMDLEVKVEAGAAA